MTLQDLIDFMQDGAREQTLTAMDITRCLLLAYEMGLGQGKQEAHGDSSPTRCIACGRMVPPRIQEKMYCSVQCKARLGMRRMRRRRATARTGQKPTPS